MQSKAQIFFQKQLKNELVKKFKKKNCVCKVRWLANHQSPVNNFAHKSK